MYLKANQNAQRKYTNWEEKRTTVNKKWLENYLTLLEAAVIKPYYYPVLCYKGGISGHVSATHEGG